MPNPNKINTYNIGETQVSLANSNAIIAAEGVHKVVSESSSDAQPQLAVGDSVILEGVYNPNLKGAHAHIVPQGLVKAEEPGEHRVLVHSPVNEDVKLLPMRAYEDTMQLSRKGAWLK